MTASAIASRYANALVDVLAGGAAGARPQEAMGELRVFAAALDGSPELESALASPAVPPARKRSVVRRIAERLGVSQVPRNFLCVLIDHRRMAALAAILDAADELLDARLGFARARIASAQPLAETQRAALVAQLERLTGSRLRPVFTVDEELIGGAVARIGSTVYDGSVKARLESLGRRLAAE
jgi:F-type H+-transporting ATPase subunit delta